MYMGLLPACVSVHHVHAVCMVAWGVNDLGELDVKMGVCCLSAYWNLHVFFGGTVSDLNFQVIFNARVSFSQI